MDQPLDAVEYLSRSENRVQVLEALTANALTRCDLQEEIGVSQATLSRILQDFTDRGWVRKQGAVYEATVFRSWVADCLTAL